MKTLGSVKLWVGSGRDWSVLQETSYTGCHDEAPVRCPYSRLTALHGAPQTQLLMSPKGTLLQLSSPSHSLLHRPIVYFCSVSLSLL